MPRGARRCWGQPLVLQSSALVVIARLRPHEALGALDGAVPLTLGPEGRKGLLGGPHPPTLDVPVLGPVGGP